MSDGYWDAEYDAADEIIKETKLVLKSKNLTFNDIATETEIDSFDRGPRVNEAKVFLQRAKDR